MGLGSSSTIPLQFVKSTNVMLANSQYHTLDWEKSDAIIELANDPKRQRVSITNQGHVQWTCSFFYNYYYYLL